ncbi:C-C chemokine receptor type 2-like [Nerophis ophidion]|uniref:C-C chemokine receptor type 2-like n=1 Tax=Nerophis ophidion TaxID=159077 RepID=UPI002ADF76E6|nr:C-C chemokine receptor type 2-like [Nerophis ophidion]
MNETKEYIYPDYNDDSFSPCALGSELDFYIMLITVLYCLVFILGFIGNALVVSVLVRYRYQATLTDICLVNLAVSDLLFIATLPLHIHNALVKEWTHGGFWCHFSGGSKSTGFFCSIFILVVMTVDRYVVILHSAKVAKYRTVGTGVALTVVVWLLSLCISMPAFIFTKATDDSHGIGCGYNPDNKVWNVYNILANSVVGLVLPLLVMVLCYSRIIPVLMRMRSSKKHRIVKLIVAIVVVFFLLWTPYNISVFLNFLQSDLDLLNDCNSSNNLTLLLVFSEPLALSHCCLNPIIYAFLGQKFMRRCKLLLRQCISGMTPSRRDSDNFAKKSSVVVRSSESSLVM